MARPARGQEPTDQELVRQFREGDQDAATHLYVRYAHRLRALTRKQVSAELARCVDAEDVVQSIFRTFFRRVRRGCYDVPDGEELWKLFLVIALNKIRDESDFHHAAKRDVRLRRGGAALEAATARPGQDEQARVHLHLTIEQALAPLPPAYRKIVELRIAGHEVAEIAKLTGRSKRTVERNLQEFRQNLQRLLTLE